MTCRRCEEFKCGRCEGLFNGDAVPSSCTHPDFCNSQPMKDLRKNQRAAFSKVEDILALVRSSNYPKAREA